MLISKKYKVLLNTARSMRKAPTLAEDKLWNLLKGKKFNNLKILRQKLFGEFIVDFYCHKLRTAIELDGEVHKELNERDKERDHYLKETFKIKILRYDNNFILNNNEEIIFKKLKEDLNLK